MCSVMMHITKYIKYKNRGLIPKASVLSYFIENILYINLIYYGHMCNIHYAIVVLCTLTNQYLLY